MEKLLLILIIVLAIVGLAQIAKVYQLSAQLTKKREEDISPTSTRVNANLLLLFMVVLFVTFIWQLVAFWDVLLPEPASEHGVKTDRLFNINWLILIPAFFLVNFLLFFFSWKYAYDPKRKALYLSHNNTLELIWTIIPSIVLVFIIIYGLITWNNIMDDPSEDAIAVELYSKQFDWTARYAGADKSLGESNYTMITGDNPLGLITKERVAEKIAELDEEIAAMEARIANEILPDSRVKELKEKIGMRTRQRARVMNYMEGNINYEAAHDDVLVKGEFVIPVGREVSFYIRSRDVIHSAYMPHFRAQMNAVPGMTTQFKFTPTITTSEMRQKLGDPEFNYVLLCNKVCGSAHYNMQMNVIVETEENYQQWLAEQKTFVEVPAEATPEDSTPDEAELNEDESKVAVK
jgi:cytochrome c oxidase subunit 2